MEGLALVEREAEDPRHLVTKGISWGLRCVGKKKNPVLRRAARETAKRLAARDDKSARAIGKEALRDFAKADAR